MDFRGDKAFATQLVEPVWLQMEAIEDEPKTLSAYFGTVIQNFNHFRERWVGDDPINVFVVLKEITTQFYLTPVFWIVFGISIIESA